MANIFKIQTYWILSICLLLCGMVSSAQVCPPIKGSIKIIQTPVNIPCTANVFASPTAQTISSGESTNIVLTTTVTGTTFKWSVSQTGVTGAADGSGNAITQVLTNGGTATYTITPMRGNCSGPPINVVVNVSIPQFPVNCVVSDWSAWSDCVDRNQFRTRTIVTPASNGGTSCPILTESRSCSSTPTSYAFQFSSPGRTSSSLACSQTTFGLTLYAANRFLNEGTQMYTSPNLSTKVGSGDYWYRDSNEELSYRIDNGIIIEINNCGGVSLPTK